MFKRKAQRSGRVVVIECPYCGHNETKGPQSLVKGSTAQLVALGIEVPMIDQCLSCKATLAPIAFVKGSDVYNKYHSMV